MPKTQPASVFTAPARGSRFFPLSLGGAALLVGLVLLAPDAARAQDKVEKAQKTTALRFHRGVSLVKLAFVRKEIEARAAYLRFAAAAPVARFAGQNERAAVRKDFDAFVAQWRKDWPELRKNGAPFNSYSYVNTGFLTHYRPQKLISVRREVSQYSGGAHGIGLLLTANYGLRGGRPAQLSLGDFFHPGSHYRAATEKKIMDRLRQDPNAAWLQDGSVKTLTPAQLNNFQVEKDGLRWWFNPYEVGPYAAGIFEVKLTTRELGPDFKATLLGP